MQFDHDNETIFSIDIRIIKVDKKVNYYRLIYEKTQYIQYD